VTIDEFAEALDASGICPRAELQGCSAQEIAGLEASVGFALPARYREFLAVAGCDAGKFYVGTCVYFPEIAELNASAAELLQENEEPFALPEDAFVFLMHQGYQFNFFRAGEGDDPPVYQYHEGRGPPKCILPSFSAFLDDAVSWHLADTPGLD